MQNFFKKKTKNQNVTLVCAYSISLFDSFRLVLKVNHSRYCAIAKRTYISLLAVI